MKKIARLAMFGCAVAMVLTACGGTSPNDLLEAAGASSNGDSVSASVGGTDVSFGGNERPDWLPSEFLWPEGFEAQYAVNDSAAGEFGYVGTVAGGDVVALEAEQLSRLAAAGYERLGDTFTFLTPDGKGIDVTIRALGEDALQADANTVVIGVESNSNDAQTLRDVYAPTEGEGTMAVRLGDTDYLFTGACSLRSTGGQLTAADDDPVADRGDVSLTLSEFGDHSIQASITTFVDNVPNVWVLSAQDAAGNPTAATMTGTGFTVEGSMANFGDGSSAPVTINVTCPA